MSIASLYREVVCYSNNVLINSFLPINISRLEFLEALVDGYVSSLSCEIDKVGIDKVGS